MADDLKYGYKGAEPTQSFGNNTGVFDPNDINNLIADNKWTTFGQLELIETKSITSSTASMIFSDIQESTYNVHFLTYNNFQPVTSADRLGLRFFENGVEETASVYQYANQSNKASGAVAEVRTTADNHIRLGINVGTTTGNSDSGYIYCYNLGDSSKYSFTTIHTTGIYYSSSDFTMEFGSGVLPQASTVNQIKLFIPTGNNIANLQASLYGIRYS